MVQRRPSRQHATPKQTSAEWLIYEILDDETDYNPDVEVLKPDSCEEPDCEKSGDAGSPIEMEERWRDALVQHMKSLTCNPQAKAVSEEQNSNGRRKRSSNEAFDPLAAEFSTSNSESQIEVTEIAGGQGLRPRPKRMRYRRTRSKRANGLLQEPPATPSEAGQFLADKGDAGTVREESATTDSPASEHKADVMDLD